MKKKVPTQLENALALALYAAQIASAHQTILMALIECSRDLDVEKFLAVSKAHSDDLEAKSGFKRLQPYWDTFNQAMERAQSRK